MGTVADLQFTEDVRYIILNRALGKEERVGDFSIAGALRDHPKDFEFASGKRLER